ncbi:hypothetical protein J6590_010089 [Homalodisca vitripennis]|nr:hypothetical protein J6590_010089 [Homalodisca vitripennis]
MCRRERNVVLFRRVPARARHRPVTHWPATIDLTSVTSSHAPGIGGLGARELQFLRSHFPVDIMLPKCISRLVASGFIIACCYQSPESMATLSERQVSDKNPLQDPWRGYLQ